METVQEKENKVFTRIQKLRKGDGLDNTVSFKISAILSDETSDLPYETKLENADGQIDDYLVEKPRKLLKKLSGFIRKKEFGKFAWELWSGVKNRTIDLEQLLYVMMWLDGEQVRYEAINDELECQFFDPGTVCYYYAVFASFVLKKGFLEGWWQQHDGRIFGGNEEKNLDELGCCFPKIAKEIRYFDYEKEQFMLAPLDCCTKDNSLSIFSIMYMMWRNNINTPEKLQSYQHLCPQQYTRDNLRNELHRISSDIFCFYFLERADVDEIETVREVTERMDNADNVKDMVLAETERGFLINVKPAFPWTTYMLLTRQIETPCFLPEESEKQESK